MELLPRLAGRYCNRCGQCCENIHFLPSPQHMDDLANASDNDEVNIVARMLVFKGTVDVEQWDHVTPVYVYSCKNFKQDENGLGVCTIHETRPFMCSGFPFYGRENLITVDHRDYPSQYKGCTYNLDDKTPVWDRVRVEVELPVKQIEEITDEDNAESKAA